MSQGKRKNSTGTRLEKVAIKVATAIGAIAILVALVSLAIREVVDLQQHLQPTAVPTAMQPGLLDISDVGSYDLENGCDLTVIHNDNKFNSTVIGVSDSGDSAWHHSLFTVPLDDMQRDFDEYLNAGLLKRHEPTERIEAAEGLMMSANRPSPRRAYIILLTNLRTDNPSATVTVSFDYTAASPYMYAAHFRCPNLTDE